MFEKPTQTLLASTPQQAGNYPTSHPTHSQRVNIEPCNHIGCNAHDSSRGWVYESTVSLVERVRLPKKNICQIASVIRDATDDRSFASPTSPLESRRS